MASPLNNLGQNTLVMAQMISYAKGQEVHQEQSAERKERQRQETLKLQQAKKLQQEQQQAPGAGKSMMA